MRVEREKFKNCCKSEGVCRINIRFGKLEKTGEYVKLGGRCDVNNADLFYDIANRKFIRGTIYSNSVFYKLRPGQYIEMIYYKNWFYDPPSEVSVALIEISDDLYLKAVSCIVYSNSEFVLNNEEVPLQVKDLVRVKDIEYESITKLFDKTYDENENEKLLKFVLSKKEIVESE